MLMNGTVVYRNIVDENFNISCAQEQNLLYRSLAHEYCNIFCAQEYYRDL